MIRAVVDVGSNSVLLLVARLENGAWTTLAESSEVTALGEGVKTSGVMGIQGMAATLAALRRAFHTAHLSGASEVVAAATMAARMAKNAGDFLASAKAQGTPVYILSGDEEARLGFLAVAEDPAFGQYDRLSIVDIGGHSTEIATSARVNGSWHTELQKSFALGTLGLRETVLSEERPRASDLLRATSVIDATIGLSYIPGHAGKVVALGATGTNLVTIRDCITTWDPTRVHGQALSYEDVSRTAAMLCALTDEERGNVPGMEPGREKTLHIGALILERYLFAFGVDQCVVSTKGWRHALLAHPVSQAGPAQENGSC
jgi:exopolyphosphatase/guanosine-5'-triphosphate,3'-diphosphate pyrophosphatase